MTSQRQVFSVQRDLDSLKAVPLGFRFSGLHAGIKRSRPDLALVVCDAGAEVAACVTQNQLRAACARRTETLTPTAELRAIVINSGNANAMSGPQGVVADAEMASCVAAALGCRDAQVLTGSTGTIGVQLPVAKVKAATPQLVEQLSAEVAGVEAFGRAILTTDTGTKFAHTVVELAEGEQVSILGVAKGSGMIHPNMATTLAYVVTDAAVPHGLLQAITARAVELHFNRISVDGVTSTNDMLVALASGATGYAVGEGQLAAFAPALEAVVGDLADQIVLDGEGATRMVHIDVSGADSEADALVFARGIARSPLFKCGVFAGSSWAWGRLCSAAGQAAAEAGLGLEETNIEIAVQGETLVSRGVPRVDVDLRRVARLLEESQVHWQLSVGQGPGCATIRTCDLTYDYVRINADEARQLAISQDGQIARSLSLDAYSPTLRHQLLVDALSYARRFTGLRVLVRPRGAVLARETLCQALARDLDLVVEASMRPLVVCDSRDEVEMLKACLGQLSHRFFEVEDDVAAIAHQLDRGQPCMVVCSLGAEAIARMAVQLGCGKLVAIGDDSGLRNAEGSVTATSAYRARSELASGELVSDRAEHLELIARSLEQGVPAIHLIDGRIQHALVGELFTKDGVGSLISRQISDTARTQLEGHN